MRARRSPCPTLRAACAVAACAAPAAVSAAPDAESEVWKGVFSSFATPLEQLVDGTAQESLSWRFAFDQPLKAGAAPAPGSGQQGTPSTSSTVQLGFKYTPLTSWFAAVNFSKYLKPDLQQSWHPDFTYAFGYDDWRPYTLSVQYANYGGNRLSPDKSKGEKLTNFQAGSWNLSFKFPLPQLLEPVFLTDGDDAVGCVVGANLTPQFSDLATNSVLKNKRTLSLGCKYSFRGNWYFNFAVTKYLVKAHQQPWDPDFTYGFGYFDWRPGKWGIQYNNYSGNRFPWHTRSKGTGNFRDGSVTVGISGNWL